MAKVKLSDVIIRANTKVDKDNTDLIYYVGGEHFCSGDVTVDQKGLIAGSTIGPMFYYGFKAGQFLLVSRNPHLRKAGVVNFDGICSEKTFVLESADPQVLSPAYLPFVLQNERFWNYAVEHKHGSTNFFINWLPAGKITLSYVLRPTVPGRFHVLPAQAQSMYAPEYGAHTAAETLAVEK